MNRIFAALGLFCVSLMLTNCKSDDGGAGGEVVVIRDTKEVYDENKGAILDYLSNNYMIENADGSITFDSITSPKYNGQRVIKDDPRLKSVVLKNDKYLVNTISTRVYNYYTGTYENKITRLEYTPSKDEVDYTVYYLTLNQGQGVTPHVIDSVYTKVAVTSLKNEVVSNPIQGSFFSYPESISEYQVGGQRIAQLTSGERQLLQFVKTATNLQMGSNGITYDPGSAGRIIGFIPSGLYLFNQSNSVKIKSYEPAIVDLTVINTLERDHDLDGIPSKYEVEPSKIGTELTLEDYFSYSTSGHELTPNFLNVDDDDDGVPTRIELQYYDEFGIIKHYSYDDPRLKICSDKFNYLDKSCRPYINEDGIWVWEQLQETQD